MYTPPVFFKLLISFSQGRLSFRKTFKVKRCPSETASGWAALRLLPLQPAPNHGSAACPQPHASVRDIQPDSTFLSALSSFCTCLVCSQQLEGQQPGWSGGSRIMLLSQAFFSSLSLFSSWTVALDSLNIPVAPKFVPLAQAHISNCHIFHWMLTACPSKCGTNKVHPPVFSYLHVWALP